MKKKPYHQLKHDYFTRMLHERGEAYKAEFISDYNRDKETGHRIVEGSFYAAVKDFSKLKN